MTDHEFIDDLRVRVHLSLTRANHPPLVYLSTEDCAEINRITGNRYFIHRGSKSPGLVLDICRQLDQALVTKVTQTLTGSTK